MNFDGIVSANPSWFATITILANGNLICPAQPLGFLVTCATFGITLTILNGSTDTSPTICGFAQCAMAGHGFPFPFDSFTCSPLNMFVGTTSLNAACGTGILQGCLLSLTITE
jgi:hypothetical protein